MDESRRWVYLICLTATFAVLLSFLLQATVVGIFFVLPYFTDCEEGLYSPLESSSCLSSSAPLSYFTLPPTCARNNSFPISYCSESGCARNVEDRSCSTDRCCCRSIPQTRSLMCLNKNYEVSINLSCVYTSCDQSIHSVLVQLYDSADFSIPPVLFVRIGSTTLRTNTSGRVLFTGISDGEYAVSIRSSDNDLVSTEYFHASRLQVDFNSPPEVVYIVYAKRVSISNSASSIGNCTFPPNTTRFTSVRDLLTLPNDLLYNNSNKTLFIPQHLAFTSSPITISINCSSDLYLFLYSNTTWSLLGFKRSFTINSQENGVLWALASQVSLPVVTFYLNTVGYSLSVDRGAIALVHQNAMLFASRVTLYNQTVSIPVINSTDLRITYVTTSFSPVPSLSNPLMVDGGNLNESLLDNCLSPHSPRNIPTAVLSETNSPDSTQFCYYPIITTTFSPGQTLIFSILVTSRTPKTIYFSTLETNALHACVRYPCNSQDLCLVNAAAKGGTTIPFRNETCSLLGQQTSLSACNSQLP